MASLIIRNALLTTAVLTLAACGARSPDLPKATYSVSSFSVKCDATTLDVGQTTQCYVPDATCYTTQINAQGGAVKSTDPTCPAATWSTNPTTVGTIVANSDGISSTLTAVAPGTVNVIANIDGTTNTPAYPVVVNAACVNNVAISTNPNTVVSGPVSVVAGATPQLYVIATYNDGTSSSNPASAQTDWSLTSSISPSSDTIDNSHTATSGTVTTTFGETATDTVTASYPTASTAAGTPASTCGGAALTATATLNIAPASLVAPAPSGLCIELATSANTAARTAAGATGPVGALLGLEPSGGSPCLTPASTAPLSLGSGNTQQFSLRARYDLGNGNIVDYDATNSSATTWGSDTSASLTVLPATSVTSSANGGGYATGHAAGSANVTASFQQPAPATPYLAVPYPVIVKANLVLGTNSLGVSSTFFSNLSQAPATPTTNPLPTKFACVGATDAVAGLQNPAQLQGQLNLVAQVAQCNKGDLVNGSCPTSDLTYNATTNPAPYQDATNANGVTPGDAIHWTVTQQSSAYWDGAECVLSGSSTTPPALVGTQIDTTYPLGRVPGTNGVVIATGSLDIGFSCVTATYSNSTLTTGSTDGMTVLVLPVTNDVLLGASSNTSQSPETLCGVLAPVFQLAASNPAGGGVVTQLLSSVLGIVNPVLQGIDNGTAGTSPVTTIVDDLATTLNPLTNPLLSALSPVVTGLNTSVVQPLYCSLGTVLTGLLTGNLSAGAAQACVPVPQI